MADRGVQRIDEALFDRIRLEAAQSPRRRKNHDFHEGPQDPAQRFLNVLLRGTYVRPHRHITPPKAEAFVVLRGRIALFLFDDAGTVIEHHVIGPEPGLAFGIDVPAGRWHSLVTLTDHAVCYEVKPGPYHPAADKDFAPWAPAEGSEGCLAYVTSLLVQVGLRELR